MTEYERKFSVNGPIYKMIIRNYNGEDLFVHALHDTVPEITKEEYRNGSKIRVPEIGRASCRERV